MSQKITQILNSLKNINSNSPLFFILGPCVIETEEHSLKAAEFLTNLATKLNFNFIFKSSFDKANRTSLNNFRGTGFEQGLKILERVRKDFDVPVITDIHEISQVNEVASVVDVLQIPALLSRQTDLLVAAGKTGKFINIKKGQFIAPENMKSILDKVTSTGNQNVWACERGYSFGYNNLIVDYRNFSILKRFGHPVVFDATHSVQTPSAQGCSSGGDRRFALPLAISAVAQGISGVFMEVHDNPEKALCDGPNSIRFSQLEDLLKYLIELDNFVKSKKLPEIS
ncbi:MAG: 2-dehydro-3-deoxyphosphooctonate aldolase [candidate division TM6 bacterium GW2011_GWF2_28_16]|nr:MAG: 2-dehydro-3-deoxyphosphooctonate aldolase [candidate division TM6 bacterium GW2011_GWF2_28_16]